MTDHKIIYLINTFILLSDCIYEEHGGCLIRSRNCQVFWWSPCYSFFSCPIICLYVLSSVCFVVVCAYLCSTQNMLCFVLFFCVYVASFSELSFLIAPSVFSNVYFFILSLTGKNIVITERTSLSCMISYYMLTPFGHILVYTNISILPV